MADRARYAIIPTNGRDCLRPCLEAIVPQVSMTVVINTSRSGARDVAEIIGHLKLPEGRGYGGVMVLHDVRPEPNISKWWNMGLDAVAMPPENPKWDVAIINDDVIVPPGWFDAVSGNMRMLKAAAGCSGGRGHMSELFTQPSPVHGNPNPLQGFAFMVAGELGLRANEDIPWYFSDNFMDWESRKIGGTVVVPGFHVQHLYPNGQMTGELHEANARGAQAFSDFYEGVMPW